MAKSKNKDKIANFILKTLNEGCMDVWRVTVGNQTQYVGVLNTLIDRGLVERELNMCFITPKGSRAFVCTNGKYQL